MPVKRILRKFSFLLPSKTASRGSKNTLGPPREHPRAALATDVKVEGQDFSFNARSVQLGTKGMSLEDGDQLSLGQPVQLSFALPTGCRLSVGAVVWWKRNALTGLRFDPREDYYAIQEWIEMENGDAFSGRSDSKEPQLAQPRAPEISLDQKR